MNDDVRCWSWKVDFENIFVQPDALSGGDIGRFLARPVRRVFAFVFAYAQVSSPLKKVKVKASHTRHRALGPELIPVYRQSACR